MLPDAPYNQVATLAERSQSSKMLLSVGVTLKMNVVVDASNTITVMHFSICCKRAFHSTSNKNKDCQKNKHEC